MALTPEDVVNKRFQPTKFREGYDQDEVDDFLDEVVVELRRLNQENEELRQRLIASDSRIAELQRSGGQGAQAPASQAPATPAEAAAPAGPPVSALLGTAPVGVEAPQAPQPEAPTPAAGYQAPVSDANAIDPTNTNNLLQLARRLHEEHVREGVEKRDALIAEGHATAARLVAEAEQQQRAQLGTLDQERSVLEHRIDELRTFEREYRQKLKGYIEGQLRELDSSSEVLAGAPAAAAPVAAPAPAQSFGSPAAPPPANYPGFASN
ncbi:MAG TPA: DivIVA domain-containing protein [Galbitalea sp.]